MQNKSNYNKKLKSFSRELRKNSTKGEIIIWKKILRNKKFYVYQFNRQYAIGNYIADFICRKLKLVIEIDGYSHNFKTEKDFAKDKYLKNLGYTVIQFKETEIYKDMNNVIRTLEKYYNEFTHQSP
ncbi:MAG: DNA methylase [Bacteroidetes bacterium]|nr:MAG: DNA methylase [Bacteroidota bacterium]